MTRFAALQRQLVARSGIEPSVIRRLAHNLLTLQSNVYFVDHDNLVCYPRMVRVTMEFPISSRRSSLATALCRSYDHKASASYSIHICMYKKTFGVELFKRNDQVGADNRG